MEGQEGSQRCSVGYRQEMEKWKGGVEARDTDSDQLFSLLSKDVY